MFKGSKQEKEYIFPNSLKYVAYVERSNNAVMNKLSELFNQEIQDNYYISAVVKNEDKWIFKFERRWKIISKEDL